jgi:hypothetical protein
VGSGDIFGAVKCMTQSLEEFCSMLVEFQPAVKREARKGLALW